MVISTWAPLSSSAGKDAENYDSDSNKALKSELACLYKQMSSGNYTSALCNQYMKGIDKLLRQKQSASQEICQIYKLLMSTENEIGLIGLLNETLPIKFSKLQYFLRIFALRSLSRERAVDIEPSKLLEIAGNRDQGRIAAIDFILTRSNPQQDFVLTLNELIDHLEDKKTVFGNPKRNTAISHLRKLFPESSLDLLAIQKSEQVVANIEKIIKCSPESIQKWLNYLLEANNSRSEKEEYRLSTTLVNLGLRIKESPISVAIWSASIRLENPEKPSKNIFGKVWKLILALNLHCDGEYSAIPHGVVLCFKHLGIKHDSNQITDENLLAFSGVASALLKVTQHWAVLFGLLDPEESFTPLISRLFLLLIAQCEVSDFQILKPEHKQSLEYLMKLALLKMDTDTTLELENAYCTITGSAYNLQWLESMTTNEEVVKDSKKLTKLLELLIQSYPDKPVLAYSHLINLLKQQSHPTDVCLSLIKEYGFVDLLSSSNENPISTQTTPKCGNISTLALATDDLRNKSQDNTELFEFLISAWLNLKSSGCYLDGLKYLKSVYLLCLKAWGQASIRTWAVKRLLQEYRQEIGLDYEEFVDICQFPINSSEEPLILSKCIDEFVSQLRIPPTQSFQDFCAEYRHLEDEMSDEFCFVWTSIPPCSGEESKKLLDTQALLTKILSIAQNIDVTKLTWEIQYAFAEKLRKVCLLATSLNLETPDVNPSTELLRGMPVYASRAFHNSVQVDDFVENIEDINLPENTLCVCLSFAEDANQRGDILTITRIDNESSSPFVAYLPLKRSEQSGTISYIEACESINEIVNHSFQTDKTNIMSDNPEVRRNFWKTQTELDKSLSILCTQLQDSWIGGFAGLTADSIESDKSLLFKVNQVISDFCGKEVQLKPWIITLMQLANNDQHQLQDLVSLLAKSISVQANINIGSQDLMEPIKEVMAGHSNYQIDHNKHIVLVCDRKATAIPWEQFPILKSRSVTRVLSLHHLHELTKLKYDGINSQHPSIQYLVNPGLDLPPTAQHTLESFKQRGWTGLANKRPSETDIIERMRTATSFVYVGHGSGKNYVKGASIRQMYTSPSAVFLLGCKSVAISNPQLDDDALTEYVIKGSSLVMGTLWPVKDKDFNRFSQEFLSRVFDDNQRIGEALRDARAACVLPVLTGAAPVVYGLP